MKSLPLEGFFYLQDVPYIISGKYQRPGMFTKDDRSGGKRDPQQYLG
jgi:hypothetical protein